MKLLRHSIAPVLALIVGLIIGAAALSSAPETPEPEVVEKEVEVIVEKKVEVPGPREIVEVEKSPESCIAALDTAEEGFGLAGAGFDYAAAAITAAGEFDVDGIEAATDGMVDTNDELTPVVERYNTQAAECRAAE